VSHANGAGGAAPPLTRPRRGPFAAAALCALATLPAAQAQFDPARVADELPSIAARYPDPATRYATPAFRAGRQDFTTHAEVLAFARGLAEAAPALARVDVAGRSQQGREMPLLLLGRDGVREDRPTVLVLGQQHGNEPAGGEAALALADTLVRTRADLLARVNVLVLPRANPDGAERFARTTASGVDVNRDHLLLHTPEARAIAEVARRYRPAVALDLHEFTVGDRWVRKFGVVQRYDALIQPATVANLHPDVAALAARDFEAPVRRAVARAGLEMFTYHTASQDASDQVVSMGGVQPDTGRNVSGLRPAVSLLIETRGVGLGRQHLARRVHAHVVAAVTVVERAARLGPRLPARLRRVEADTAGQACRGELVIDAQLSPGRQAMDFLDAATGAPRRFTVAWRAASPLRVTRTRPRPCGYLLDAGATQAVARLRALGVAVTEARAGGGWQVERYVVESADEGQRQDARGAIEDGAAIRVLRVRTAAATETVAAGTHYVSLAQPLGPLVAAALEPDSQSSYAANRLLDVEADGLRRVMAPPPR
jgi:hypothetical protein